MITPKRKGRNIHIILETGIVAVIRAQSSEQLVDVAKALRDGGVKAIEVTMTTPNALEVINTVSGMMKDECVIGVGTVLDPETARAAILAGAEYVVSPTLNLDAIKMCRRYNAVCIPGAYTPTEILTAWEAGADVVKVFPASTLGPGFFKDVLGPLPQIRLSPTGGVSLDTVADFIKAGACCVAAGGNLVSKKALAENDWAGITQTAQQFIEKIKEARES
ncbi:MAG: bifunctional 4-hydroxy-2-oxoglutarate aldolase/2-dehydro-3-deoxy-phosphogluconate aldolase [Candidatus Omnitrophica bacterium]|nr:bifunctional 4-hydroxy-2-oxoglutarate aldolase/2-dehydro-3-deoxy-phosphogluconate aldolase [Candidatus Omnitrophota bacterium]